MPATPLIRVLLPAPLSPTSAVTRPLRTTRSTSWSTCTAPKLLFTPRSSKSGSVPADRAPPASLVIVVMARRLSSVRRKDEQHARGSLPSGGGGPAGRAGPDPHRLRTYLGGAATR